VLPLIRQCGPCGQREIDDLAHEFGVTPEFMTRRLQDLQTAFQREVR
jgi:hypothetical protein